MSRRLKRRKITGFEGYLEKVLAGPSGLASIWLGDERFDAVSYDRSGHNYHGAYTGVTLGQPGVPEMGMTSPYYDALNDSNGIYSVAFDADFNGAECTWLQWIRVNAVGVWADGVIRYTFRLQADGNNFFRMWKHIVAGRFTFDYTAGAVPLSVIKNGVAETGWIAVAITCSKLADKMIAYWDGAQEGAVQNGLGVWAGPLAAATTVIGASSTGPGDVWHGWLGPALVYTTPLSPTQIAYLSEV